MTERGSVIPPLVLEFEVAATVEHAFMTWFGRTALWWPRGHTVSGRPEAIVFEPRAGGRIYERDADGAEHEWGEVIAWEPPARVECSWHLFFPRAEATRVVVTFAPLDASTLVRLEQTGWHAHGVHAPVRRERTITGWGTVTAAYRTVVDGLEASPTDVHDRS